MSLIHEALKKAEEQRRLGQPPDLASPFARPRERRSLLPILLVAIVIAGAAGWWLMRAPTAPASRPAAEAQPAKPATTAPTASRPDSVTAAGLERTAARSSAAERVPVAPPPGVSPPPVAAPTAVANPAPPPPTGRTVAERTAAPPDPADAKVIQLGAATKPEQQALAEAMAKARATASNAPGTGTPTTAPIDATKPSSPAKVDKVPVPDTGPTIKPAAAPQAAAPSAVPASPVAAPGESKPEPSDPVPVAATPAPPPTSAAAAPATAPASDLPLFWQLPYNVRKDLPQLAVTMHVFSADPGQRFVVINGDRKGEGEPLGNELRLAEIRADGIVLEFRGQRFLVPRGG